MLVLWHLSSRGARLFQPTMMTCLHSFLRDVAAYIARCQSVKTLKRHKPFLGEFSWLGHIALESPRDVAGLGFGSPSVSIMYASSLSGTDFSPQTSWLLQNEVQVLPESHPAPLNMQRCPKCACTIAVSPKNALQSRSLLSVRLQKTPNVMHGQRDLCCPKSVTSRESRWKRACSDGAISRWLHHCTEYEIPH